MYDQNLIDAALRQAEKQVGFKIVRHSRAECQSAAKEISSSYDIRRGQYIRPLHEDERRWVVKEQALCRHDYLYWATRYCSIISKEGKLIPYNPNKAQLVLHAIRSEHQRRGIAMAFINLKARQLGVTTDSELVVAHRVQFGSNVIAVIGSASPEDTAEMFQKIMIAWRDMPFFLMPEVRYREGQLIEFRRQNSRIGLQWLNQKKGIARGRTPLVVHLSEVSDCDNPEDKIEASLLNAMHESPLMYLMLESTAKGMGNWWHKKWVSAKRNWGEKIGASLRPIFLPWYIGRDIYPSDGWMRSHPIPSDWKPEEMTRRHAARAVAYVKNNEILCSVLGADWTMPSEQMWNWEVSRKEAEREGTTNKFFQERCADDIESFQLSKAAVFEPIVVQTYHQHCREPIGVYGLRGSRKEIPERCQPSAWDIDANKEPFDIKARNGSTFQMVPLKWSGVADASEMGKIFIWEKADERDVYGIGVDPSFGVGQNRSAIEVMRKGGVFSAPGYVAEYASDRISGTDMMPFVLALHEYYRTKERDPLLVIELTAGGEALQRALLNAGCGNHHVHKRLDRYQVTVGNNPPIGVTPTTWLRNTMLELFIKSIRDFSIEIDSPYLIQELGVLAVGDNYGKIEAEKGNFDDRLMAAGWVLFALHFGSGQASPELKAFGLPRYQVEGDEKPQEAVFRPDNHAYTLETRPGAAAGRVDYVN